MSKRLLILIFGLGLLLSVFWIFWSWGSQPACSQNCQSRIFVIPKGEGLGSISKRLENEGLIRNAYLFQLLVSKNGLTRKIQAGSFRLSSSMSPLSIAQELTHGTLDYWVTLLEGWRREEIAEKLGLVFEESSNFNQSEFLKLTAGLEGKLFPDTYLLPQTADAVRVVAILTNNFEKKTANLKIDKDALVLASIVEREAKFDEDRPIVAGILLYRLSLRMALQTDATVQYALATSRCPLSASPCTDWWPSKITKDDLKIKSPYNTYLYPGLPPSPIANPGIAAIKAILNPAKTDFMYYLSDQEGRMHYARTLDEHNQNIQKYLLPP